MKPLFVTGTDTDVGKTLVSIGLCRAIRERGINLGVMKPFAASGSPSEGFASEDTRALADAAGVSDPESMINPQFFPMAASPYTVTQTLGIQADVDLVLKRFGEISKSHDMVLVEGMGGIMTPIRADYFVADLIREMDAITLIVASNRIGTVNHTLLTHHICKEYGLTVAGVIINCLDAGGYPTDELKRDIEGLTGVKVLGAIPRLESADAGTAEKALKDAVNIDALLSH